MSILSSIELYFQLKWIVVILFEHDEIEEGNENSEGGDDEGDQHNRVFMQDQRIFVVHCNQEVKMY